MQILYSFPHVLDRPGIAVTALNQVLGMSRLGAKVILFCASVGNAELPASVEVHETLTIAGHRVPHRALGVQRAYNLHDHFVARWLTSHPGRVDLVHAWPRGCVRTLRAARKAGTVALRESPNPHTASVMRASLDASENAGVSLPAAHSHASNDAVLKAELLEYAEAAFVLVPSDYAHQEFIVEGFPRRKLLQHRYGCDLSQFSERPAPPPTDAPLRIAFVGRGDPTKGLHIALRAWEQASLPDASLIIAGRLEPRYAKSLERPLQLPGVNVAGFVSDIPSLLAQTDILILPTWTEGSALVTYEAQASGCVPLVSSASGAFGRPGTDFVEHHVGAVGELAGQLRSASEDRTWLQRISLQCTRNRGNFSWDEAAVSLQECYARALASH